MYENVSLVIVLIPEYVRRTIFYVDVTLVAYNIMSVLITTQKVTSSTYLLIDFITYRSSV